MPRRLLFALLIVVAAPLALLGWLSASTYRQQQETARRTLESFFQARLAEIDGSLADVIDVYHRELARDIGSASDRIEKLKELDRANPIVRTTMFVNSNGVLVYPPSPTSESSEQIALYAALPAIISSKPDLTPPGMMDELEMAFGAEGDSGGIIESGRSATASSFGNSSGDLSSLPSKGFSKAASKVEQRGVAKTKGGGTDTQFDRLAKEFQDDSPPLPVTGDGNWQVWYMDEGMQLIYWIPQSDGAAIGVLLERARWIADLTAALPDSPPASASARRDGDSADAPGFTVLADETKRIVYRWGDTARRINPPVATRSLTWPLTSWRLEYYSEDPLPGSAATALIASLAGIGVVLLALGVYVLTGIQRQMRAARSRVSFASQVSHELRTPLTNIRLYAELAESDLQQMPKGDSRSSIEKRLGVIDSESRRLGRLVSGVLEMIRDNPKKHGPRIAPAVPDHVIDKTITQFAPSFQMAGLAVHRDAQAEKCVGFDADILEMILVNLFSNVEKYARDGGQLEVSSRFDGMALVVRVADHGKGISWRHRQSVFRPFSRLDDSISAPSGTGIGLTIAKRLARRHGGDLQLVPSEKGACFEFRLLTKPIKHPETEPDTREEKPQ